MKSEIQNNNVGDQIKIDTGVVGDKVNLLDYLSPPDNTLWAVLDVGFTAVLFLTPGFGEAEVAMEASEVAFELADMAPEIGKVAEAAEGAEGLGIKAEEAQALAEEAEEAAKEAEIELNNADPNNPNYDALELEAMNSRLAANEAEAAEEEAQSFAEGAEGAINERQALIEDIRDKFQFDKYFGPNQVLGTDLLNMAKNNVPKLLKSFVTSSTILFGTAVIINSVNGGKAKLKDPDSPLPVPDPDPDEPTKTTETKLFLTYQSENQSEISEKAETLCASQNAQDPGTSYSSNLGKLQTITPYSVVCQYTDGIPVGIVLSPPLPAEIEIQWNIADAYDEKIDRYEGLYKSVEYSVASGVVNYLGKKDLAVQANLEFYPWQSGMYEMTAQSGKSEMQISLEVGQGDEVEINVVNAPKVEWLDNYFTNEVDGAKKIVKSNALLTLNGINVEKYDYYIWELIKNSN